MARHNKRTIQKPQYKGNYNYNTKNTPNKRYTQFPQPTNNIISDIKFTTSQRIYRYLKYVSVIDNGNYSFTNIINFLHKLWKNTGNILINNDIVQLIGSKYVCDHHVSLRCGWNYMYFPESMYNRIRIYYNECTHQICDIFINSYDKYFTSISRNDPLNYPEIVKILQDTISCDRNVQSIILQMALDRKNMYCVSLILKNIIPLNNIIVTLVKYNVYVEELGCNLAAYIVDNYLDFDAMRHGHRLVIDNNLVNSIDSFGMAIIKEYYREIVKFYCDIGYLVNVTCEQLDKIYGGHKYVIMDVLLDIAEKYGLVQKFLDDTTMGSYFTYRSKQRCTNLTKTKQQFKNLWNVDIVYTSQINSKLIYLLLMIAKDSRYRNSGFKYLMRKIIGWYYCLLY